MLKRIPILLLFFGLLAGCTPPLDLSPLPPVPTITPIIGEIPAGDGFAVYFTDPDDPNAGSFRGGPDSELANAIRGAGTSRHGK